MNTHNTLDDGAVEYALAQARMFRMHLRAPPLCYPSKPPRYNDPERQLYTLPIDDVQRALESTGQALVAVLPVDRNKRYVCILHTAPSYARLFPSVPASHADPINDPNPPRTKKELRKFPTYHSSITSPLKTQPLSVRGDELGRLLLLEHVSACSIPLTPPDISAVYSFFSGSKRAPPSPSGRAIVRGTAYLEDSILHMDESMPFYHKRGLYYTAARSTAGAVLGIVNIGDLQKAAEPGYLVVDPHLRESFGSTFVPQEEFELQQRGAGALVLKYPGGPEAAWNGQIEPGLPLYTLASNHSWLLGFIHWNRPVHFASPLTLSNLTRIWTTPSGEQRVILGITGGELAMLLASGAYEPHTTKEMGTSLNPIGAPPGTRYDLPDVIEAIREHTDDPVKMASMTMSDTVKEWFEGWGMMGDHEVLVQKLQFKVDGEWVSQAEINEMD